MPSDLQVLQNVRQLAQVFVPNTNAMSLISKTTKRKVVVTSINVVNTSSAAQTFSIYLDKDGTTYSNATALLFNQALAANTAVLLEWQSGLPIDPQAAGNLAFSASNANVLTVTINGLEL